MERPAFFEAKKWTLVVTCAIYIVLEIIYAAFAGKIADAWIEENKGAYDFKNHDEIEVARKFLIISVVVSAIIAIIFQLIGLFGAIRESFCLVLTFVILHFLGTIGSFAEALRTKVLWGEFAWSFIITLVGVLYVRDLVLIRRRAANQQYA